MKAAERLGGMTALARFLGLTPAYMSQIANFYRTPRVDPDHSEWQIKLADMLDLPLQDILPTGLDKHVQENDDSAIKFCDLSRNDRVFDPAFDEHLTRVELSLTLSKVLDTLTDKERDVMSRYYGLNGNNEESLAQIGKQYGVCRERIRQILGEAMRKLRHPSRARQLAPFL